MAKFQETDDVIKIDPILDGPEKVETDLTCTCGSAHPTNHWSHCDLWDSWYFDNEWAEWDEDLKALVFKEYGGKFDDDEPNEPKTTTTSHTWGSNWNGFQGVQKCRHYQQEVVLPDETMVYASSHRYTNEKHDVVPDLGIYLDGVWKPDCRAYHIGCPDFGTPNPSYEVVMGIATEALETARDGKVVEIGCIGGHGRTGLFLSVLTLMTMENPNGDEAVDYVRKNYCDHAVEGDKQKWYLKCIASILNGEPLPEPPPEKVFVSTWKSSKVSDLPVKVPVKTEEKVVYDVKTELNPRPITQPSIPAGKVVNLTHLKAVGWSLIPCVAHDPNGHFECLNCTYVLQT